MSRISNGVEAILFRSRFLLAPLYLGLVGALALLAYRFVIEFWHLAEKTADMNAAEFTLALLALLDLTLLANLILMVIFAGYENFVSRIDIATESKDRPHWMGTIDFSGLKIKFNWFACCYLGNRTSQRFHRVSGSSRSWRRNYLANRNPPYLRDLWRSFCADGLDRR